MHFILIHFRKIQHLRPKITARRNEHQGLSADALLCERFQSFGNLFRLLVVGKGNGGETEDPIIWNFATFLFYLIFLL